MRAGAFDRRITLLQQMVVKDTVYNTSQNRWIPVAHIWAQIQDMLPSRAERVAEGIALSRRPARLRIRWRSGITTDMRISYAGRMFQIVSGPAEIGRREVMEMMIEEISTVGEAL